MPRICDRREEGKVVVGQAGLLALAPGVGSAEVARWLAEARAFAVEWAELRAVQQNQLSGTPLRCPLQVGAGVTSAHVTFHPNDWIAGPLDECPRPRGCSV